MAHSFQIDFDIDSYKHLWPETPPSNEIINVDKDLKDAVWSRQIPTRVNRDFLDLETKRLRQGAHIYIKDELLWLPPNYYHFLENGIAGTVLPEFRLKELENNYFKLQVRANPHATGTFDVKNRQDGRTTRVMSDCLFEMMEGVNYHGQINIQSKTNNDGYKPCWTTLQSQWLNYPQWLKDLFYSDFASGSHIETAMRFVRAQREIRNSRGETQILPSRNLSMSYYPAVFNAQDGSSNVLKSVVDEFLKWIECDPAAFLTNSKQFMQVGANRKGIYEIISSPADFNHKYLDKGLAVWQDSNPEELDEYGTTKSGLFRFYSDPRKGIDGFYDKYGDADADKIVEHIMRERGKKRPEELLGEVRANPLDEEEMFGATESNTTWDNHKGIVARKKFLISTPYKDVLTQEPRMMWGNLEWPNGIPDSGIPEWRPHKENKFDLKTARFAFSDFQKFELPLLDLFTPPEMCNSCLGVDPFNNRYGTKKKNSGSNGGALNYIFRSLLEELFVPHPNMMYGCRPHQDIFHEDMIKAALFCRSMVQYENRSDKLANWFEDRGYFAWLLPEVGQPKDSTRKGDAPGGRNNRFLNDGINMINTITNIPSSEGKPYLLNSIWFEQLLQQIESFKDTDTHKYDLVMAFIQALLGAAKMSSFKVRNGTQLASEMISYLLS